ncbi:MAG: CotH kinase family protein, partial [Verrucomicrobiota bacterium]
MTQWHSVNEGPWIATPMLQQSEGHYEATVPGGAAADIIQFYVESHDALGAVSHFPAGGPDSRALIKVDDGLAAVNGRNNFRLLMLPSEAAWMRMDTNVMSNDRLGSTVIFNETDIYYNTGVRHKGSERHRLPDNEVGFNVSFPADNRFQGVHRSVAIDRSQGIGFGQREMLINIALNRAGGLASRYSDFINVLAPLNPNTSSAELQLARYNAVFLDAQFENGGDGPVYEYELTYFPTTTDSGTTEGNKRPQPDGVRGTSLRSLGPDKEQYRWLYLIENNRDRDEYDRLMEFLAVMPLSNPLFNQQVGDVIDVNQWLRSMSFGVASGCGDNFAQNSAHNGQFYVRPSDQRVLFFPHDMDAFHSTTRPLANNTFLNKLLVDPGNTRQYHGYMYDLLTASYNRDYIQNWTDQLSALSPEQNFDTFRTFIGNRHDFLMGQINQLVAPAYPFNLITTNGSVAAATVHIDGEAWIDVEHVFLDGWPDPLPLTWTSSGSGTNRTYSWTATVPLDPGPNTLTFLAY